jgi:hypothetical protein
MLRIIIKRTAGSKSTSCSRSYSFVDIVVNCIEGLEAWLKK